LSTKNENVDKINMRFIDRFSEQEMVYHSFDVVVDDPNNNYPPEFLNSLTPSGLPPHILKLKVNCPVILLRSLDPPNGLCNGTRLIICDFHRNTIDAEIVLGQHAGKRVFLPRIPLCPSDDEIFPFKFKRTQFPLRLSFAMTVNKAQGQTIPPRWSISTKSGLLPWTVICCLITSNNEKQSKDTCGWRNGSEQKLE
jgi:ATP-dependent DNA helicase PIF1